MSEDTAPARRAPSATPLDPWLLAAVLLLTGIGLVMVYSASAVTAQARVHDQFYYLKRQLVAAGVGLALLLAILKLGYRRLEPLAVPLLLLVVVALLLVLVPGIGKVAGGARRWIDLGFIRFQPAEAAKVVLVLYLARSLARKKERMRMFSIGFLPHVVVTGLLVALVLAERDLGTAVILLLVPPRHALRRRREDRLPARARWRSPSPSAGTSSPGRPTACSASPPSSTPGSTATASDSRSSSRCSASATAGWLGQGLGEGKGKLFYLPAAHTDFIAAVIAEEVGLLGMSLLVLLFAMRGLAGLPRHRARPRRRSAATWRSASPPSSAPRRS